VVRAEEAEDESHVRPVHLSVRTVMLPSWPNCCAASSRVVAARQTATKLIKPTALLQLRVLGLCLLVDGDVRIGIFPNGEEVLICGEGPDAGGVGVSAL
jgi:hypothetical protein